MKSGKQFNFHKFFIISAITIGVGFFLFSLIFTRVIDKSETKTIEMGITEQKQRETVLESPGQSTVQSSKLPSEADIEAAIAALENMDTTESRDEGVESSWDEENSETPLTDSLDKTPLSYEEELKQRYWRIRKSPEYKELNDKIYDVALELESLGNLETPAHDALVRYWKNTYSVFGLTEAEANEREWSDEQIKFMHQEGERFKQEWIIERDQMDVVYREKERQRDELYQRGYELLGMTQEEVLTVLGRR